MARYIDQPEKTETHRCDPPVERYTQVLWRSPTEVRTSRNSAVSGTVWQCDCQKIWRFGIDGDLGSWYLLEPWDVWLVHPRKTLFWKKTVEYSGYSAAALVIICLICLIVFHPIVAGFVLFLIGGALSLMGVSILLDKHSWDHEVQDATIGEILKK